MIDLEKVVGKPLKNGSPEEVVERMTFLKNAVSLSRKIKTGAAHAGISEAEIARRLGTTPQSFSKRVKTYVKRAEELEALAAAMGAELRLEFVFPDGFTV